MSIVLAANSGFCFGVKRAIKMAEEARSQQGGEVYTLGEIIHNPQIVEQFDAAGIKIARDVSKLHNVVVIIRSHGISRQDEQILRDNGCTIVDATCPYVKRTHELTREMAEAGYTVLICGDESHPEVIGMKSYGNSETIVVSPQEAPPVICKNKVVVICQTTQKVEKLQSLVQKLLPDLRELRVFNTICHATQQRQEASLALARESDLMIVIGGKNSSNTRMLHSICKAETASVHIETELELDEAQVEKAQKIGITAGASTPDEMILKVYNKILKIKGNADFAKSICAIPGFKEESC